MLDQYIRIGKDNKIELITLPEDTCANMAEAIGCELIEIISQTKLSKLGKEYKSLCMIIDESGRLKRNKINLLGTRLYSAGGILMGDILIGEVKMINEEQSITAITESKLEKVMGVLKFMKEECHLD